MELNRPKWAYICLEARGKAGFDEPRAAATEKDNASKRCFQANDQKTSQDDTSKRCFQATVQKTSQPAKSLWLVISGHK